MSIIQISSGVKRSNRAGGLTAALLAAGLAALSAAPAVAQEKKPNVLVIMGDDVAEWLLPFGRALSMNSR